MDATRTYPPHIRDHYDLAIVGAGPAGLSAAAYAQEAGLKYVVIESGRTIGDRKHDNPASLASGVGGAGLYSDGKFSFFPSASALWNLGDETCLELSYEFLSTLLTPFNIPIPPFQLRNGEFKDRLLEEDKKYPSYYLSLESREKIIRNLENKIESQLLHLTRLISVREKSEEFLVYAQSPQGLIAFKTTSIIYAAGRFGPLELPRICPDLSMIFRRYEIGLRLEQPADEFIFEKHPSLDVKKIQRMNDSDEEWRTFCTCRNGEVVEVAWDQLRVVSGRADGKEMGFSNIGINLRMNEPPESSSIQNELYDLFSGNLSPKEFAIDSYLEGSSDMYGPVLDAKFRQHIRKITEKYSLNLDTAKIYGPCVEGVGNYPDINSFLKMNSRYIWVAGDSTGFFRGLTASLVSGNYCARQAHKALSLPTSSPTYVKESEVAPMPVVFTAQSKEFFYCRDAICEFVLRQGLVPLNPFRIFEYFLDDRVDREVIRNGNNQLISTSDEVWVFGTVSNGVLFEIVRARHLKKPVRFYSIATRADEIKPISIAEVKFDPEIHAARITRKDLLDLVADNLQGLIFDSNYQLELSFESEPEDSVGEDHELL